MKRSSQPRQGQIQGADLTCELLNTYTHLYFFVRRRGFFEISWWADSLSTLLPFFGIWRTLRAFGWSRTCFRHRLYRWGGLWRKWSIDGCGFKLDRVGVGSRYRDAWSWIHGHVCISISRPLSDLYKVMKGRLCRRTVVLLILLMLC